MSALVGRLVHAVASRRTADTDPRRLRRLKRWRRETTWIRTGIADNILAARLKMLTEEGILERRRYQARPARYEYLLTEKGMALE